MSEWSKEPDSKSGALFTGCLGFESLSLRHIFILFPVHGEVSERPKEHDWKLCVGLSPTVGSNPTLSAIMAGGRTTSPANPVRSERKQR